MPDVDRLADLKALPEAELEKRRREAEKKKERARCALDAAEVLFSQACDQLQLLGLVLDLKRGVR